MIWSSLKKMGNLLFVLSLMSEFVGVGLGSYGVVYEF